MMSKSAACLLIAVLPLACGGSARAPSNQDDPARFQVISTPISDADCDELTDEERQAVPLFRTGEAVLRCPGGGDLSVNLVDDGTRSWYVLDRDGRLSSLEDDIVYGEAPGHFPNVGANGRLQWVLDPGGEAVGLVFQVTYQSAEVSEQGLVSLSRFFAYSLTDDRLTLVERAEDEDAALARLREHVGGP